MAPELIKKENYDNSIDFWSLGIIIYEMMKGTLPFYNRDKVIMLKNIST